MRRITLSNPLDRLLRRAAAIAVLLVLSPLPAAADWSAGAAIPTCPGAGVVYTPSIALAANHSAAIAWRQASFDICVATRAGELGSWVTLRLSQDTSVTDPSIAIDHDGNTAVVWTGFGHVFASYRRAAGAWGTPATLEINANSSGVTSRVMVAMNDQGDVVVGWIALNAASTAYEVHTVVRTRDGSWPATGAFEIAGSPAYFDDIAVAIDDHRNAAVAWGMAYTVFSDDPNHHARVIRGAVRPPQGPWGAAFDLSTRAAVGTTVTCEPSVPAVPTASDPFFATDPATGDLALVYDFDPTAYAWIPADGACDFSPADFGVRVGAGTVTAPPAGGADYDVGLVATAAEPRASLRDGKLAAAWPSGAGSSDTTGVRLGLGNFGGALTVSQIHDQPISKFDVAMGGTQRAFATASQAVGATWGWSSLVGGGGDGPTTLQAAASKATVAASCEGYGLAAMAGQDHKVYVATYPAGAPWCPLALGGSFENGSFDGWLVFP